MAACGQRINERKKNCKNLQKSPKKPKNNQKKTYLGPKQHDLTRHLDLEMVEMGALWLRLVKESTKEKKTQQKSAKMTEIREITKKKNIPWAQTTCFNMLFGLQNDGGGRVMAASGQRIKRKKNQ